MTAQMESGISKNVKTIAWFAILLTAGILSRWIPHPPNFTALLAVALFAGRVLPGPLALVVPVLSAFLGDLWLGFHPEIWAVYISILVLAIAGQKLPNPRSHKGQALTLGLAGLVGNLFFFVTTNLAMWWASDIYPHTAEGLTSCFVLAIPFLNNSILGTWVYITCLQAIHLALPWLATAAAARATSSASPK